MLEKIDRRSGRIVYRVKGGTYDASKNEYSEVRESLSVL